MKDLVDLRLDVNLNNIISVIPMTIDELNDEKKKVIESARRYKEENKEVKNLIMIIFN